MPETSKEQIRVIAICIFRHDDHIFVLEGYDELKSETFYRPLGGGIEFWEGGRVAIAREIKEEVGAEVDGLSYIGTIESIFIHRGERMHEIVQVYSGRFVDTAMNDTGRTMIGNEEGEPFKALWKPLSAFRVKELILYPSGLLEMIDRNG
jgi:ADP-ribose pyrophosphatase YjhB (NUDIX family)